MTRHISFGYKGEPVEVSKFILGSNPTRRISPYNELTEQMHINTLRYMFTNITSNTVHTYPVQMRNREYVYMPLPEDEMWQKWEAYRNKHNLTERVRLTMDRDGRITGMKVDGELYARASRKTVKKSKKQNPQAIQARNAIEDAKHDWMVERKRAVTECNTLNSLGALLLSATILNPQGYYAPALSR